MTLTGCSKLNDNEKLLRPPELSGEYQSIYDTLQASTSLQTLLLQPPTSGKYRSSITIQDNSIDNSKYAIAFYKNEIQQITDKISLRMGILKARSYNKEETNKSCNYEKAQELTLFCI